MTASTKLRVAMVELWLAVGLVADSVAGLKWTAPREWTNVGTAPMRAATYKVPLAAGDHGAAECVVYFFGKGQGGPIDANIERWRGQFRIPPESRRWRRSANGWFTDCLSRPSTCRASTPE